MKKAFVVACTDTEKSIYFALTMALIDSLRKNEHNEEIVIMITQKTKDVHVDILNKLHNVKTWRPIVEMPDNKIRPARFKKKTRFTALCGYLKIYSWALPYDKIIYLDADCLCKKNFSFMWDYKELTGYPIPRSPMNGCFFVAEPSMDTYNNLKDIIERYNFNKRTGWDNIGSVEKWKESIWDKDITGWCWPTANTTQGLLYYYFHFVKNKYERLHPPFVHEYISHYGGKKKWIQLCDENSKYSQYIKSIGLYNRCIKRHVPRWKAKYSL